MYVVNQCARILLMLSCINSVAYVFGPVFFRMTVPAEYHEIKVAVETTSLAMLLPSDRGLGLCSFGLVTYLMELQNQFRAKYNELRPEMRL